MTASNSIPEQSVRSGTSGADTSATTKVASAAHSAVDAAAANLEKAELALRDARAGAGDTAGEAARSAQIYSEQALTSVKSYINENPIRSVGIALATGYLLSAMLKRK